VVLICHICAVFKQKLDMPKISYVIPCYYNEKNIPVTSQKLIDNEALFLSEVEFEYVMVDDGSKDNTFGELCKFHEKYPEKVKVVKLAKNCGSTNAVYAGMKISTGDCIVIMSADLQDPLELIPKMYDYWKKGIKLVVANRTNRDESMLQKFVSNTMHNMMRRFALPNIPKGGFDFELFDREVCDKIVEIDDKNSYLPYFLIWLGYEYVSIPYVRLKREIGKSSWTLAKKIKTFIDSFVSFSFLPLRLISTTGLSLGMIALLYALFILIDHFTDFTYKLGWSSAHVDGWSSTMLVLLLVSSFQMISLGIIGEYVWRAMEAARSRPNYVIDKILEKKK
jgi:polyisoprenyl-phosphate glycosyltransferase